MYVDGYISCCSYTCCWCVLQHIDNSIESSFVFQFHKNIFVGLAWFFFWSSCNRFSWLSRFSGCCITLSQVHFFFFCARFIFTFVFVSYFRSLFAVAHWISLDTFNGWDHSFVCVFLLPSLMFHFFLVVFFRLLFFINLLVFTLVWLEV